MFLSHVIACMSNADQLAIVERAKGGPTTSRPMAACGATGHEGGASV